MDGYTGLDVNVSIEITPIIAQEMEHEEECIEVGMKTM